MLNVGYIGRYRKFCPELALKALFIDDYNSFIVHYDAKKQRAWFNGEIDEFEQFTLNGKDLIKNKYEFSELVFHHDGKKFTTKVIQGKQEGPFREEISETWSTGWEMKDTDTLIVSGKMRFPDIVKVEFLLQYDPSNGWRLSTTKPITNRPRYDVFLFAKEPIYKQLLKAFQTKDKLVVMVVRYPWESNTLTLRKPTKLELSNDSSEEQDLCQISITSEHIIFNHEKLAGGKALVSRIKEYENMSMSKGSYNVVKIEIREDSNDQLLRDLLGNIDSGNTNYIVILK